MKTTPLILKQVTVFNNNGHRLSTYYNGDDFELL